MPVGETAYIYSAMKIKVHAVYYKERECLSGHLLMNAAGKAKLSRQTSGTLSSETLK